MSTSVGRCPRGASCAALDLPAEIWAAIGGHLSFPQRLALALVCKQLYYATRTQGASLWTELPINFSSVETLRSFAAWRRRCTCAPLTVRLQHGEWHGEQQQLPEWEDVVETAKLVVPSLTSLMVRWDGAAVAGEWLRDAILLEDLGLYCGRLMLTDALGILTQLKELSLESPDGALILESADSLPRSLTRLFAVECLMSELPEALTRLSRLECAYLSRNPLIPASLSRLAGLPRLQLLSLIGCWFERPPPELSALTSLRACYMDYNSFGGEVEQAIQSAFSTALRPLVGMEALGLSHLYLDSWPAAVEGLPQLKVLYLESNPGIARLPPSAAAVLARLRVLSCDCSVLFSSAEMFRDSGGSLEHLFVSGSGLMWHAVTSPVRDVLAALAAMRALKRVTFVVQTQKEEVASVDVTQLQLQLLQHCPGLQVDALDSEGFYGVTLKELDAMA